MSNNNGTSLPEEIQNLGRKARARLETERNTRREIHRVEILPPQAQRGGSTSPHNSALIDAANLEASKKVAKAAPKKRKRATSKKSDCIIPHDSTVDRWMPDVSRIPVPTSKDSRSNLVQLHGLPLESATSHILRFFSGLDPRRILYVPATMPRFVHVHELDATATSKGLGATVERHEIGTRIFVKFESAPTAALAIQRSGEVLQVTDTIRATIAVIHVSKNVASYLLKNLAIDLMDGESTIERFRHHVEKRLDPVISMVLWEAAISDLHLQVEVDSNETDNRAWTFRTKLNARQPVTKQNEKELRAHISKLTNEIDRLQNMPPFPSADSCDPVLLRTDPILNLTCKCVDTLQKELERSRALLAMASRWSLFTTGRS